MLFSGLSEKDLLPHPFTGDRNDIKRFVILTYPRTGSHFLIFRLRNSGPVAGYGELFHQKKTFRTLYPGYDPDEKQAAFRNKNPEKFLQHIFSNYSDEIRAAGFKINYNQLELFKSAHLIKLLNEKFGVSWIHLKRRNCFMSYVSLKLMQQTKVCFAVKPEIEDVFSKNTSRFIGQEQIKDYNPVIRIQTSDMILHIRKLLKDMEQYDAVLKSFPHTDLYYEDLADGISGAVSAVSVLLFNDPGVLNSADTGTDPIVKLNTRPFNEVIENYDEVSKALKDSGYGYMLA